MLKENIVYSPTKAKATEKTSSAPFAAVATIHPGAKIKSAEPARRRDIPKDSANKQYARRAGAKDTSLETARVHLHSAGYSSGDNPRGKKRA